MATATNLALMHVARRAEKADQALLVETFVDDGALYALLTSPDHQIVYGRRGTGKTHLLTYVAQDLAKRGDLAVYVDLRSIGSSAGLYASVETPIAERGSRLLLDVLTHLYNSLVDDTLTLAEAHDFPYDRALHALDELADEITRVRVEGDVETRVERTDTAASSFSSGFAVELGTSPTASASRGSARSASLDESVSIVRKGPERYHVNFGSISQVLSRFLDATPVRRLWILLDEWSSVPLDLQPLLADLLRRSLLPVPGVTVKIGAIEQMARFRVPKTGGGYVGLEVGADVSADLDLDDFMVFDNDPERAKDFFLKLLFKHVRGVLLSEDKAAEAPASAEEFLRRAFSQVTAVEELVRAAEGVPRDAINIANLAAQAAGDNLISVPIVRAAARTWYLRDKETAVSSDPLASALLHFVQDEVIGKRRARAFLLQQHEGSDDLISSLYSARVLHVIKRGVAAQDMPGVRFDAYSIDYGAYVELISTARAPLGLFDVGQDDEAAYVEVPVNDYRSIRRAILSLGEFRAKLPTPSAL